MFNYGVYNYLVSSFNVVNFCMNIFYITAYGLKFYTMLKVSENVNKVKKIEFWDIVNNLNNTNKEAQVEVYSSLYWLNAGNQ
jgi:hypothetical protein